MEGTQAKKRLTRIWLWISLALMLVSMIGASLVQTSGGNVTIRDFQLVVSNGKKINAQIYIPNDASAEHKLPLVIAQHGSQHNLEMQDMNMVELSRRGYIVISSDAFRHGSSTAGTNITREEAFSNVIYMVDYASEFLNIVDTDKIGLVGHSMGAAIVTTTLQHFVTQEALGLGENKIAAALEIGYDPSYTPYTIEGVDHPVLADSDWGVIAGKYDEYFFRQEDVGNNPARILESAAALAFVQQVDPAAVGPVVDGKIYRGQINGQEYIRAFYQNPEIHPQNVFSTKTAADVVDFFYESLGTPAGHEVIASSNQVWVMKQVFNLLGLIGILLFLFPFASWIIDSVPYFASLKATKMPPAAPALNTGAKKSAFWVTYVINLALPAVLAMPVMHYWIGKESFAPSTATKWFGIGALNEVAVWSIVVGVCLLAITLLNSFIFGKKFGIQTDSWGVKISLSDLWKSLLLAVMTFGAACLILFFADFAFNTDFRFWLVAMRVFTVDKALYLIAYVPAFMFFYLVNSLMVNGCNRVEGMPDWLVTLISCFANAVGIAVLISIQYIVYAKTGNFVFNAMRTHNLFPFVVLVPVATIITRAFFKKTGKIYLGSFTIALLYTILCISQFSANMSVLP